ncbi:MAG TPA: heme lyase CcmF/NrfE family subunit [Rhodanobacteraceae bacterium]|nr:heme lyase CcmF/NrfE family subunit [Rhodanobacteraceae bacterium]
MTPELGQFALILALLLALAQGSLPLVGAWRGNARLMATARPAAIGQAVFVALAFAILVAAFLGYDFSVAYVADNSNLELPWYYRVAATWGAHEGSLLLWILILNLWTLALAAFSRQLPPAFAARVLGVLGLVSVGFLLFIVLTSNPFTRLLPAPLDGADLNPVLQDPGMALHPPLLYMGYVGFSVAFAFAIAALIEGRVDEQWVRWARPWTNIAWGFLTMGIVAGSHWAYYELGWGGWWFWDPVENASFMPWLVGAALIHAQAVTDKRKGLRAWTVLLSLFAFALSLLGTFLVRSGVLTSVHAFASDPRRGIFILVYLGIVIGGSLLLYALRAPRVAGGKPFAAFSRETAIVIANLLLTAAAAMVLLGTLYPLIGEAFNLGRISVGAPYFGFLFVLLMTPLVLVLPTGPLLRWGRGDSREILRAVGTAALAAIVIAAVVLVAYRTLSPRAIAGALAAAYVLAGVFLFARKRWREAPRGRRYPLELIGLLLAHAGIGIFIAGAMLTTALGVERDVRLAPGESVTVGSHQFRFDGVHHAEGPNWTAEQGTVSVFSGERLIATLHPQKRTYPRGQVQTEAAIEGSGVSDLYVALGEAMDKNDEAHAAWSLRIYDKPFVRWIWFGGILMMLGGFTAAADRRFRARSVATTAAPNPEAANAPHGKPAESTA